MNPDYPNYTELDWLLYELCSGAVAANSTQLFVYSPQDIYQALKRWVTLRGYRLGYVLETEIGNLAHLFSFLFSESNKTLMVASFSEDFDFWKSHIIAVQAWFGDSINKVSLVVVADITTPCTINIQDILECSEEQSIIEAIRYAFCNYYLSLKITDSTTIQQWRELAQNIIDNPTFGERCCLDIHNCSSHVSTVMQDMLDGKFSTI